MHADRRCFRAFRHLSGDDVGFPSVLRQTDIVRHACGPQDEQQPSACLSKRHPYVCMCACQVDVLKFGQHVATLNAGQFFGEKALLTNRPRGATCRAAGMVRTLCLTKGDFDSLLGAVAGKMMKEVAKVQWRRGRGGVGGVD